MAPCSAVSASLREISMRDKGLDPRNDKPTRTDFVRRVALALGHMQRKGEVEKVGRGRAMRRCLRP
jgi:hypothetical protein